MARDTGEDEWHVTTDRQRIVARAEQREAVPVRTDSPESGTPVRIVSDPEASDEEIDWEEFFEQFEAEGLLFRYREGGEGGGPGEVVRREGLDEREAADEKAVDPDSDEVESEQIAVSDTGDAEPVIYDRVDEKGGEYDEGSPGQRSDRGTQGTPGPKVDAEKRSEDRDDGDTAMSESARDAEEAEIVLDEVYEDPTGFDSDAEAEYLVFRNTGGEPIDLGGWSVENEEGWSYVFPQGFVLDPGARVTLHSGQGTDADADLYWGAEESVWDPTGDTVELRTPGGDRVVHEPIKD